MYIYCLLFDKHDAVKHYSLKKTQKSMNQYCQHKSEQDDNIYLKSQE